MPNESKTGETVALVAPELRGHACALADEYGRFLQPKEKEQASKDAKGDAEIELRRFQARHVAGKAALAHLELLLRIARAIDGGASGAAEAERNLARPA